MKNDEDIIDLLPGELKRIAEVAGLEAAVRIARSFKGAILYVPGLDDMTRMARDAAIRKDYSKGINARDLSKEHHISERQIRKIVSTQRKDNLPDRLIELLLEK